MRITLPVEDCGKCGAFVDDIISVCVDIGNNKERLVAASATVIDTFGQ